MNTTTHAADRAAGRRLLFGIFRRQRRRVMIGAACWTSYQTCEVLVPVAIGIAVDAAVRPSDPAALVLSVLGIFAVFITLTASWRAGAWVLAKGSLAEAHRLRSEAVRRILTGTGITTTRTSGELLSITTSDAKAAAEVLELGSRTVAAVLGLILSAFFLLRIDFALGLGILLVVPLLVLGLNALSPYVQRRTAAQQEAVGLAAGTAADLLQGLRPLRGFGGVLEAARRYRLASGTSLRAGVGALRAETAFLGATTFTSGLLLTAVAGVAGAFALQGRISVGELITVVGLASFLADPVYILADCVFDAAVARASARRVAEVLDAPVRTATGDQPVEAGPLELIDVEAEGLAPLTLRTEPGELLGVVTQELAAAEVLVRVLSGVVVPTRGEVRLGGRPLGALELAHVRKRLLVEPHHVDLFGATIRAALLTDDVPEDGRIATVVRAAAVGDFADSLDRGLTDHGQNLSGGQRQRLAMARALLADRPILVLHDPTTAVDAVTENAMGEGLCRLRAAPGETQRSTVLITTSPPLLNRCSRVLFVEGGGRVRTGTHGELLRHPGYAETVLR